MVAGPTPEQKRNLARLCALPDQAKPVWAILELHPSLEWDFCGNEECGCVIIFDPDDERDGGRRFTVETTGEVLTH